LNFEYCKLSFDCDNPDFEHDKLSFDCSKPDFEHDKLSFDCSNASQWSVCGGILLTAYCLKFQASHLCFEVKSDKLSQVAVGLSEQETVTPPAKSSDSLSACDEWGRIPTGCG